MKKINIIDAKNLMKNQEVVFLDVRSEREFEEVHLKDSINVPLEKVEESKNIILKSNKNIIFICKSGNRSQMACKKLNVNNPNIYFLDLGIDSCLNDKNIVRGKSSWGIERQVRLVAGFLVFLGTFLGYFVNNGFYLISTFVGLGLMFAAISNTCMMGTILMKLPYNKAKKFSVKKIEELLIN